MEDASLGRHHWEGIIEKASGRRHHWEGIVEGASQRRCHGGGIRGEASWITQDPGSSAIVRGPQGPTEPSGIMCESSGVI